MKLDPDHVRVDLLRIKRKLFLSFPEGSKERQNFLCASKLAELNYLSKLVAPEVVGLVFEEYNRIQKLEVLNIILCLGIGACFSVIFLGFHQLHPENTLLSFFYLPVCLGVGFALTHIWHMIEQWRKFQPFEKDYEGLQTRINKLINELRDLTK